MKQQTLLEKTFHRKSQGELQPLLDNDQPKVDFALDEKIDKYSIVYWIYILYGITSLLPWNVFITASGYFTERFAGTAYEKTFQNYFSTYFTCSNLMAYIVIMWLQNSSYRLCIDPIIPIIFNIIIFAFMAITVEFEFMNGSFYFYLVMVFLVLTGVSTCLFQNAVFSEASQLPPIYLQAVLGGQGIAGVIVAITSVISLILPTASSNISAFIYFIAASFLSATALMGRFCISHNSYYRAQKKVTPTGPVEHVSVGRVVSESARYAFCVGYLFVVTIMVFPSITSLVKPVKPTIDGNLFVAFHFLIFNIGDWMGRTLPLYKMFVTTNINRIVLLSIARTAFIPLFLICHVVPRAHGATFINNDVLFLVLCWMFALTNGWLCSLVMMAAPQAPGIREEERAMVGSIMSFTLVLGLAMGGSLSFVTRLMV